MILVYELKGAKYSSATGINIPSEVNKKRRDEGGRGLPGLLNPVAKL